MANQCRTELVAAAQKMWESALASGVKPHEIGIIMSGGVDTCAVMEALSELGHQPAAALTVFVTPEASDLPYATACASKFRLTHHAFHITPDELLRVALPFSVRVLGSFDGMQLRNSIVVAYALLQAKRLGLRYLFTGDASDELLGGYSFVWKTEEPVWSQKRAEMCAEWFFAGPQLAKELGIRAESPFCSDSFKSWALSLKKSDCIGERPIELVPAGERIMHVTGKLPLREAYPDAVSAWRRKDPIEIGSGSTLLGKTYFDDIAAAAAAAAKDENDTIASIEFPYDDAATGVQVRCREHAFYLREFTRHFPQILLKKGQQENASAEEELLAAATEQLTIAGDPLPPCVALPERTRGPNGCIRCGFELYNQTALFCRVCGAWPARTPETESS